MENKYFVSNLLPRQSWKWLWANDKKSPNEKHRVFITIQKIEKPSGSLKDLIESFSAILSEEEAFYDDIFIEEVSFHRGCGDYDHEWHIVGSRLETDEEFKQRRDYLKAEEDKVQALNAAKVKAAEEKEYQEFLKLQKKFNKE
jgi:hypothetical protein